MNYLKLRNIHRLSGLNGTQFAKVVGIERTVFSNLKNNNRPIRSQHIQKICNYLSCSIEELEKVTNEELKGLFEKKQKKSQLSDSNFLFTNANKSDDQLKKIIGQYELYHFSENSDCFIVSLFEIKKESGDLIVKIFNPYLDEYDQRVKYYQYSGKIFYNTGFFHIYLEEVERKFSIAKISLADPNTPQLTILRGVWHGIGVLDNKNFVAAVEIILLRCSTRYDTDRISGNVFGYKQVSECPQVINRMHRKQSVIIN